MGLKEMAFHFGQVFECTEEGRNRQAIVLHTRLDGQEALLRYVDTRAEVWTTWSEFDREKWHWTAGER